MAIGQRLYTRRLCLLPHPQRNREGGLQLGRLPEGARVTWHDALAHRMAENPEASGALGERNSGCESAPAVSNDHGRLPRTLPRARQTHSWESSNRLVLCPVNTFTGKLSFSACLAENPGALIENRDSPRETRVE